MKHGIRGEIGLRARWCGGLDIDDDTGVPTWSGERLDLDHAITALLCIDRPGFAVCQPHGLP